MNCPDYFPQITQINTDFYLRTRINRIEQIFLCPYGQKSIKIFFDNLRLFEPEIFLSRQAPKIVLMIFYDFCSEGAWGENQNGGQSIGYAKLCVISFAR